VGAVIGMLYDADAPVVVVVQPVHLKTVLRIFGVHVSAKHGSSIVVVFLDIGVHIEIGDTFINWV
jgi:hypothetical protein